MLSWKNINNFMLYKSALSRVIVVICISGKIDGLGNQTVIQASCGSRHSLALTQAGEVFSWGDNNCCQLGRGQVDADLWRVPK